MIVKNSKEEENLVAKLIKAIKTQRIFQAEKFLSKLYKLSPMI